MIPKSLLLVMDVSALSPGARIALLCLIGLLLVTLGIVFLFAVIVRRQLPVEVPARPVPAPGQAPSVPLVATAPARAGDAVQVAAAGLHAAEDARACPSCRREFEGTLQFCPHDARALVPAPELLRRPQGRGTMCITCRRAFDAGVRFCAQDGSELVPLAVYEAIRGEDEDTEPTGIIAKICAACGRRYDIVARFCGRDGSELLSLH